MKQSAVQRRARLAIRLLSVLALVLVAFAHRPVGVSAPGGFQIARHALPDGSYPVICVTEQADGKGRSSRHEHAANPACEACRIAASALCPVPAFSTGAAPHIAMAHAIAPPAPALRRAAWPPSAPPQAPPLA